MASFLQFPRELVDHGKYDKAYLRQAFENGGMFKPPKDINPRIMREDDWARIEQHFNSLNVHFDEKVRLGEVLDKIEADDSLREALISPAVQLFAKGRKLTLARMIAHLRSTLKESQSEKDYKNLYSWAEF